MEQNRRLVKRVPSVSWQSKLKTVRSAETIKAITQSKRNDTVDKIITILLRYKNYLKSVLPKSQDFKYKLVHRKFKHWLSLTRLTWLRKTLVKGFYLLLSPICQNTKQLIAAHAALHKELCSKYKILTTMLNRNKTSPKRVVFLIYQTTSSCNSKVWHLQRTTQDFRSSLNCNCQILCNSSNSWFLLWKFSTKPSSKEEKVLILICGLAVCNLMQRWVMAPSCQLK